MKTKEKLRMFVFRTKKKTLNIALVSIFLAFMCIMTIFFYEKVFMKTFETWLGVLLVVGFFIFFILFFVFVFISESDRVIGNILAKAENILNEQGNPEKSLYGTKLDHLVSKVKLNGSKENIMELRKWLNKIDKHKSLSKEINNLYDQNKEIEEKLDKKNKEWKSLRVDISKENKKVSETN